MSKKPARNYASLHTHTEFSVLDGYGRVDDYVARAVALGMPALAITDHGNMCGAPSFYSACRKAGIEPLLGEEFYFTTDWQKHLDKLKNKKDDTKDTGYVDANDDGLGRYHFVALAKGHRGYQVLSELSTEAHRHFKYKPMLDRGMLEQLSKKDRNSLVILSGCAASVISKAILAGDIDRAKENVFWWRELFPNFYLELQHHGTAFDKTLNKRLLWMGRKFDLPWVVTNDPHYVMKEECHYHDALLAIQTASDLDDPARFRFDGSGYHLRSDKEMGKAFGRYGDIYRAGANATLDIARQCQTRVPEWEARSWHIPTYADVKSPRKFLRKLAERGLADKGLTGKTYRRQLEHELEVFAGVGIESFMLITWDFIREARERRIPVGPGRGSVCGTLVGYAIGIHKIDPIKYKLRFDRFLNPARPKMPDIDTDFGQRRRPEMFEYAEEKYGRENVVKVCAYQSMQLRAAFQSVASVYGINFKDRMRISKQMPKDFEEEGQFDQVLPEEVTENYPDLAEFLEHLKGTKKSISNHPAGVIIADPRDKIRELVPEMWIPSSERWVGQYDLDAVEGMGLMKQDFLGLRTLDTIDECVKLVQKNYGVELDPDSWVPDEEDRDDEVWAMLASGDTDGVFQMEGGTNTRGCREVLPAEFEDVVSITALYRTGPLAAKFDKQFNKNRKGKRKNIQYSTEKLRPFLDATWGVILYQEQVMDIAEHLAGFDPAAVDDIKEAIKHKKSVLMKSMRPKFIKGCKKHSGISKEVSTKIWNDIEGYSGYSYNRSHAVAYTFLTYQTARLKLLYPLEFYAALLRTCGTASKEAKAKRAGYLRSLLRKGYEVLPPDINVSGAGATPDPKANAVRFGLLDIKGVGPAAMVKIEESRGKKYKSVEAVRAGIKNEGVLKALINCGAMESLGEKGDKSLTNELLAWDFFDDMKKWRKKYKKNLRLPEEDRKMPITIVGQIVNISQRETKTGKPYVTWTLKFSPTESFRVRLWSETEKLWILREGSIVLVNATWEPRWENCSIGGKRDVKVLHGVYEEF